MMAHYCGVFGLDLAEITCQSNSEGGIVTYISFDFTVQMAACFGTFQDKNTCLFPKKSVTESSWLE